MAKERGVKGVKGGGKDREGRGQKEKRGKDKENKTLDLHWLSYKRGEQDRISWKSISEKQSVFFQISHLRLALDRDDWVVLW